MDMFPPGAARSDFAKTLSGINVLAPTPLCRAMHWQGSDKGLFRHNYTTIYNALLNVPPNRPRRIFELGLGSSSSQFAFNMWAHGVPGASLRAWRQIFSQTCIFGADIDRESLFEEDRIRTFYCDQLDRDAIRRMWSEPDLREPMDVIIDDGLHTFEGNFTFLTESLTQLRPGGLFSVEDIAAEAVPRWRETLSSGFVEKYPNCEFALLKLPNKYNLHDNNLLLVHRRD